MKKLALIFSVVAVGFIFGCAKKDNNNVATTYTYNAMGQCVDQNGTPQAQTLCAASTGYTYNTYGQCIQTSTGAVVATQLCQASVNGNGIYSCVQSQTGQVVPNQYCLTQSYMYSCIMTTTRQAVSPTLCQTSGVGQQCYGPYSYQGMIYQCGIQVNCSGYLMTSLQTGQQVQCL